MEEYFTVDVPNFFDSTPVATSAMSGCDNRSISAFTKFLDKLVLRINNEGVVVLGDEAVA